VTRYKIKYANTNNMPGLGCKVNTKNLLEY